MAIAVLAVVAGGAAGWAWRLGEERAAAPVPRRPEELTSPLLDRQRALRAEAERLRAEHADSSDEAPDSRVAPRTLDEYIEIVARLARGDLRARWVRRFEEALARDALLCRQFLAAIEAAGDRRRLLLAILAEFSPEFLARPEIARIAMAIARDESADEADRTAVLGLPLPCWRDYEVIAGLAQFARSGRVREAATAILTETFAGDARAKRLLEERWWREADPTSRATTLASTLASLDGAAQAELIARASSGDPSTEIRQVAAAQVLADVLGGSERPMSAAQRAACCGALMASLSPAQPIEARRPVVVAVLAAGSPAQVETLLAYLERQETDAELRGWAVEAARRVRDAGGERDEEVLGRLLRELESLAR